MNVKRKIAPVRRMLNDSWAGRKINGSIPGILVEGLSRAVTDGMNSAKYMAVALGTSVIGGKRHWAIPAAYMSTLACTLADAAKESDPELHYAHTSRLYDAFTDAKGQIVFMDRISVEEAIKIRCRDNLFCRVLDRKLLRKY
jgi:hypothetical protein